MNEKELIKIAMNARLKAYAPYSNFYVGAALLSKSGKIYEGCNIECASFSPTNCAERTALFKAVSEGEKQFSAIAVVGAKNGVPDDGTPCAPCGVCRQMLYEFCDDSLIVLIAKNENDYIKTTLGDILPYGFGPQKVK